MIRFILYIIFIVLTGVYSIFAQIQQDEITIMNDSITLSGTLSYPQKNTPLIIWVHGSGNIDRNGNQGNIIKANYIQQFRNEINKHGIAFFSYDKRTANKNNFKFLKNITYNDLYKDVLVTIDYFKKLNEFPEIVLIGHSQGSLTAMLASKNITKFISIAGPSKPFDEILLDQITKGNPSLAGITKDHINELKKTGKIEAIDPKLVTIFAKPNQQFLLFWMQYDPSKEIKKLLIPTLIINGTKDLQVGVSEAQKLKQALPKAKLTLIPNMNHVLKEIKEDQNNYPSYFSADFPISTELIKTVVDFIKE
ncbi:alpha/beta hydrolase family protein [Tenacibaculum xiamenense]|uniref:alpha/beta hydrolase family protein n=1 Tax=Tenacibaculum xiamenense TaxID=1261553 RepID=UPI0038942D63